MSDSESSSADDTEVDWSFMPWVQVPVDQDMIQNQNMVKTRPSTHTSEDRATKRASPTSFCSTPTPFSPSGALSLKNKTDFENSSGVKIIIPSKAVLKDTDDNTEQIELKELKNKFIGFQTKWSSFDGGTLLWDVIRLWTSDRPDGYMNCSSARLWRFLISQLGLFLFVGLSLYLVSTEMNLRLLFAGLLQSTDDTIRGVMLIVVPVIFILAWYVFALMQEARWVLMIRFNYVLAVQFALFCVCFSALMAKYYQCENPIFCSMFSLSLAICQTVFHFVSVYTSMSEIQMILFWMIYLVYAIFLALLSIASYSSLIMTSLATFAVFYFYHSAVIAFHCYAKLGWLGYDWTNPFIIPYAAVWYMDGLDPKRFYKKTSLMNDQNV
ncbi:hypothetical protein MP638_001032 [Amoeboaphelidium occidentale]|nr:hypothetical protein MP638_001032 [Amoeboaphelidium occidentale]